MSTDSQNDFATAPFLHWCESCGREELLSSKEAYEAGWDVPPSMGTWGVISPRTCPNCSINTTVWWAVAIEKHSMDALTPHQLRVVGRILEEVLPAGSTDDESREST